MRQFVMIMSVLCKSKSLSAEVMNWFEFIKVIRAKSDHDIKSRS